MRHWTIEERQRQSELIRGWKPWSHSKGATTPEGTANSKMNAYKHGCRGAEMQAVLQAVNHRKSQIKQLLYEI